MTDKELHLNMDFVKKGTEPTCPQINKLKSKGARKLLFQFEKKCNVKQALHHVYTQNKID